MMKFFFDLTLLAKDTANAKANATGSAGFFHENACFLQFKTLGQCSELQN